jgi:hypothetical protein
MVPPAEIMSLEAAGNLQFGSTKWKDQTERFVATKIRFNKIGQKERKKERVNAFALKTT